MRIATKKGLHLLIITMIISIFGALSAMGVLAEESTFWVNTVEDIPIQYKVTNDGIFKEVEVIAPMNDSFGSIEIPGGNVTIPETVVHDNIEYTVTSIGEAAFSNFVHSSYVIGTMPVNPSLKNITIPASVKSIKRDAFFGCYNLTDIDLPNNLETIEDGAFYMTGLTAIEIPKSVTSIGEYAFANCFDLTIVICLRKQPATIDSTSFANIDYINYADPNQVEDELVYNSDLKIYIPLGPEDTYAKAGWPEDYLIPVYNFSL